MKKIFWDTLFSITFKNHCWWFFKIMSSIWNAFFHRVDIQLRNRTARRTSARWSLGIHRGRIYANVRSFVSQNIPHCTPLAIKHTFHQHMSLTKHKNRLPSVVWNECPFFHSFTHWSTHTLIYRDYCRCTRRTWCHPVSFERYTLPLHAYVHLNVVIRSPLYGAFTWMSRGS